MASKTKTKRRSGLSDKQVRDLKKILGEVPVCDKGAPQRTEIYAAARKLSRGGDIWLQNLDSHIQSLQGARWFARTLLVIAMGRIEAPLEIKRHALSMLIWLVKQKQTNSFV